MRNGLRIISTDEMGLEQPTDLISEQILSAMDIPSAILGSIKYLRGN